MECSKCGFNATVEQVHLVRLEKIIEEFGKFLKDTISADMLYHPSDLYNHFQSKISELTDSEAKHEI